MDKTGLAESKKRKKKKFQSYTNKKYSFSCKVSIIFVSYGEKYYTAKIKILREMTNNTKIFL